MVGLSTPTRRRLAMGTKLALEKGAGSVFGVQGSYLMRIASDGANGVCSQQILSGVVRLLQEDRIAGSARDPKRPPSQLGQSSDEH